MICYHCLGMHWTTLVRAPMCMSACGRTVKMFSSRLMDLLNMECQQLGKSSWLGFYAISRQFWHLQLQFRTGEPPIPQFHNRICFNGLSPIFAMLASTIMLFEKF